MTPLVSTTHISKQVLSNQKNSTMKKLLFAAIAGLFSSGLSAQTFYDLGTIQEIELNFTQTNWDYQLDTAKNGYEGYIIAQWVKINGVQFDSVGVKYKGNSSYSANQVKNPFHIELDHVRPNQAYQGYTDVKLGNGKSDPSMIREALSYDILKNYADCPKANFARVTVNGTYLGLYTNAESINKAFCADRFFSSDGTLVKCNPETAGGPSSGKSNLKYTSADTTTYYTSYEVKSDYGWQELVELCDSVTNNATNLHKIMDIDRAIWMLAFNNVLVNLDSYSGTFVQNYYLYKDLNHRFAAVNWDLNMSFGSFSMSGSTTGGPGGGGLSLTQMQQMTPTLHFTDTDWPLIKNMLTIPTNKRKYIAHMKTMLEEMFVTGAYQTTATSMQNTISSAVQADVNKFYTFAQFQAGMTGNVTGGMGTIPGITNLMAARITYLQSTTEFQAVAPTISAVTPSNTAPLLGSTVTITANVTTTNTNAVYLNYRYSRPLKFESILMYDDGAHGDGAAGDNVYGASLAMSSAQLQYYIYAENNNAGKFSPQRAEHEFYTLNATVQEITVGDLVINEFMAVNQSTIQDASGSFEDWIELYNTSSQTLNLDGLYLSDSYNTPLKWAFPLGTTIAPNSYLTIWADNDTLQTDGLHAYFKLSGAGERVIISYASGTVLDSISYGSQTADISYGRIPNGTGPFVVMPPTYGAYNSLDVAVNTVYREDDFSVFPNPSSGQFTIVSPDKAIENIEIYNPLMQRVLYTTGLNTNRYDFSLSQYPAGYYFAKINNQGVQRILLQP